MPAKYLVDFLAQWIRDQNLRSKVLYREKTELKDWGLDSKQIADLISLEERRIFDRLEKELKGDFNIDLAAILNDFVKTGGRGGPGGGAAGAVYEEGWPHVRGVEPASIKSGVESLVRIRGHGWDSTLKVDFTPPSGGQPVQGKLLDLDSDVDVWQRATVMVTLPSAGKWRITAHVQTQSHKDSTENVTLDVT